MTCTIFYVTHLSKR